MREGLACLVRVRVAPDAQGEILNDDYRVESPEGDLLGEHVELEID